MKREEQGPASRFGLSSEDLGSTSQQVGCAKKQQKLRLRWFVYFSVVFQPEGADLFIYLNFFFQDVSGTPQGQVPQKPIRRKYHPESQSLETGAPPPAMPFLPPAKTSQRLVMDFQF